jgi:hypothetical protein
MERTGSGQGVDRQKKEGGYELMLEPNVYYTFRTLDLGLFIIVNRSGGVTH